MAISKSKKLAIYSVASLAALYVAVCVLVYVFQAKLVYHPVRQVWTNPGEIGLAYEGVKFKAEDGVGLSAWFVPAEKARGVVLFCHGNARNMAAYLDSLRIFHSLGFSTLIYDYRGFGESDGSPSEEGTYRDARAAWNYLINGRKVAASDIVLLGRSLGGAVAAHLATEVKPRCLILESTFTSMPEEAGEVLPFLPVKLLCTYSYNTRRILPSLALPKLFIHSKADQLIPFAHGEALYACALEPKTFVPITGDHTLGFLKSGDVYVNALREFLAGMAIAKQP